jgi:hypothetical protein
VRRLVYCTASFAICSLRRAKFPIICPVLWLDYKVATHPPLASWMEKGEVNILSSLTERTVKLPKTATFSRSPKMFRMSNSSIVQKGLRTAARASWCVPAQGMSFLRDAERLRHQGHDRGMDTRLLLPLLEFNLMSKGRFPLPLFPHYSYIVRALLP